MGGCVQKLVVVGRVQDRLNQLKEEVKPIIEGRQDLKISAVRPGYLETVVDTTVQIMVFDTDFINKNIFPLIVQIRKIGYAGPVIVLGNPSHNFDLKELNGVKGLYHLHKPYQPDQLVGMIRNCLNVELMRKRRDQRFDVHEHAVLEGYSSDVRLETTISNISRSGVRIEGPLGELKQGDLLKVHFNFDKINKERVMNARVVWIKKDGASKEEAGLEFVSQKTIYQFLLDYAV